MVKDWCDLEESPLRLWWKTLPSFKNRPLASPLLHRVSVPEFLPPPQAKAVELAAVWLQVLASTMLLSTGGSTPLLCLEGVPELPVAPQVEAGLTTTFQTWPRGCFAMWKHPDFPVPSW